MHSHFRSVFVLPIFEVNEDQSLPGTKAELLDLFHRKSAIWFHFELCPSCHLIPNARQWLRSNESEMKISTMTRRVATYHRWEPLFVGTNKEPIYDERLSWEGKRDKMTHAYIMCLLDYKFNILSNAFLVHKAGIKHEPVKFLAQEAFNNEIIGQVKFSYKKGKGCEIWQYQSNFTVFVA